MKRYIYMVMNVLVFFCGCVQLQAAPTLLKDARPNAGSNVMTAQPQSIVQDLSQKLKNNPLGRQDQQEVFNEKIPGRYGSTTDQAESVQGF